MSLYARLAALIVIVLAIAGAWWKFDRMLAAADMAGYARARAEDNAAMQAQRNRNLELQRAAEKRYVVQAGIRDHYIVETITEVRHETANLAACQLTPSAVRLFNDAADCARSDRASSCGHDEPVRDAGQPR
jgi:hypothetical protein